MSKRPVPLMYIQSPSVILRTPIDQEESTSIFVKEDSEDAVKEPTSESKRTLPSVEKQLKKIQSPFGRHLYQPVQVKLADGKEAFGTIEQVEEKQLSLAVSEADNQLITIQHTDILDILWRGKSIPEK